MKYAPVLLLLLPFFAFSQIQVSQSAPAVKVGEVKYFGKFIASLSYAVNGSDTLYTFTYHNAKYTTLDDIKVISFHGNSDALYIAFKSVFTEENKTNKEYKLPLKIGDTEAVISTERNLGTTSAMFLAAGGYVYLTEKQIDKLFNRQ